MNALINAHTQQEQNSSPHVGLTSSVLPEAKRSQIGASSEYVPKEGYYWFVLRVIYNRTEKAYKIISSANVQSYVPTHYVVKKVNGKKKRILQPLLPNFFFIYATREVANTIIKKKGEEPSILKYYLEKTANTLLSPSHLPQ